ncbi:NAD(P)/FAD-dependent oxidoreductase [Bailinhaonella thermotolerans]|uniref:NAD(P)/FAD-dependent oxidoreductase n=1 Tax=Bailinhaonella thermotolerans TaxID=1070861 RepID=A0A3A4AFV0_9ACTN|nr:NAD(P)/FAD-dependent oxidoreductase [Bailinhaonella thermotolerans]RJL27229.1 NAD(P)/FAD-dependent oxidoreductase [Bailinhaonella thermotolerans]
MNQQQFDVIVVGAGPAGSCTAGLLAMDGRRVLLLDRDKHPRYHIGESLISGVWPTLDRLGVRERLEQMGFPRKYGADVLWGADAEKWGFTFRQAGPYEFVHQVRRAEFDAMLVGRARELGVHVVEDATVKDALFDGDRVAGVRYQVRGRGELEEARARFTVDATGQQRWLGRHFDLVDWHEDLRNIAIWGYWQGCRRFDGERAGHTLVEALPTGWLWFIPLGQDTTSIGYVTSSELLTNSGLSAEKLFETQLEESKLVKPMMDGSTLVTAYRTARDWSYQCRSFQGPGWALVGDASAFIDPLLSTGVTLAVRGARVLAKALNEALSDPAREAAALRAYEDNCRAFLNVILEFVRFFYDQTKTRSEYYRGAQEIIDPERQRYPEFDFVKLVSGLAGDDEDLAIVKEILVYR